MGRAWQGETEPMRMSAAATAAAASIGDRSGDHSGPAAGRRGIVRAPAGNILTLSQRLSMESPTPLPLGSPLKKSREGALFLFPRKNQNCKFEDSEEESEFRRWLCVEFTARQGQADC